jgi:hypothetical protein
LNKKSKEEIGSIKISAGEWERVKTGIKEIERGKFATFEDKSVTSKKEKWVISKISNSARKKLDSIFFTLFHKIHKYNR